MKITWKSIVAVAVLLVIGGFVFVNMTTIADYMKLPGAKTATVIPQPGANQGIADSCPTVTNVEYTLVGLDAVNGNVDRSSLFDVNIIENGTYGGGQILSSDATYTMAPGAGYAMYFMPASGSTSYIGDIVTGNAGCKNEKVNFISATVGTLSLTLTNGSDKLVNSSTNQLAIGSGENMSSDFELKEATNDACLGSPSTNNTENLKLCWDYNATAFKAPVVKLNGTNLPSISPPPGHSKLRTVAALGETTCFDLGVKSICDYAKITGLNLELQANTGQDPGDQSVSDLNAWVYIPQVFKPANGDWGYYDSDPVNNEAIITPVDAHVYIS